MSDQKPDPLECRHRGDVTREAECPTCNGRVRVKVFACQVKGECTYHKSVEGATVCADCRDRVLLDGTPAPAQPAKLPRRQQYKNGKPVLTCNRCRLPACTRCRLIDTNPKYRNVWVMPDGSPVPVGEKNPSHPDNKTA